MRSTPLARDWDGCESADEGRILDAQAIVTPIDLVRAQPLTHTVRALVRETRWSISRILAREDPRLLVVIGPCSIHDLASALEYARWLSEARARFRSRLLLVMRVYLEKPRTRVGWKGMVNDPRLDETCHIEHGLQLARQLLLDINSMGVPTATEFVHPVMPLYIGDLISWAAIGARTVESQVHRELASGLACPVGFKNGTSGDVGVALNAVLAASRPHRFIGLSALGRPARISTAGNPDCHVVLRGGVRPNYDEASINAVAALLASEGIRSPLVVDCSHGNCSGDYRRQALVAQELSRQRRDGGTHVCGVMVESHVIAGDQPLVAGTPPLAGVSVTDPCLGIDETTALLGCLADGVASCRVAR